MLYLFLGVLLLIGVMLGRDAFVKADPKVLAKVLKRIVGHGALAAAFVLLVTGRFLPAIPFAVIGYLLVGRLPFLWLDLGSMGGPKPGGQSSIRTDMLEMTLDHDSGTMDGFVRSGPFAGRRLSELSAGDLARLLAEAKTRDAQAVQLLETYIERMQAARGGAGQGGRGGGSGSGGGPMTAAEALEVLGLKRGASRDEIMAAHRNLMKKNHPDHGGSTYIASKINEAKDVLLG